MWACVTVGVRPEACGFCPQACPAVAGTAPAVAPQGRACPAHVQTARHGGALGPREPTQPFTAALPWAPAPARAPCPPCPGRHLVREEAQPARLQGSECLSARLVGALAAPVSWAAQTRALWKDSWLPAVGDSSAGLAVGTAAQQSGRGLGGRGCPSLSFPRRSGPARLGPCPQTGRRGVAS